MTMPDLFEQLDSPAENGDDWIRRLLSEPDETPSPTPAAGDDGTDTGHEPDLPQEEERIVPPQASGPGAGGDVTAPPPSGAHACFASMFVRQVRQCFSAVWADGFPRCRHRFPVM